MRDMRNIYSIDRIEGNIAVVVCDDGRVLNISRELLGNLVETDVFSAIESDGELDAIVSMPEERERRLKKARERLERLKNRK